MGFWSGLKATFGIGANGQANQAAQGGINAWKTLPAFQQQQNSVLNNYKTDPRVRNAQYGALQGVQDIVNHNGLDDQARADLYQEQQAQNDQERGQRGAIQSNARARGMGGSGLEFASNLANQQGSATRGANAGFNTASLAEQRRSQALNDLASQSGNLNTQQFGQAEAKANSQNAINAFNEQNQNQYNQGRASGLANAYNGQANTFTSQGQILPNLIGSGIAAGGAAMAKSDENAKTDIHPFDPNHFLDSITGYKYKYKKPERDGEGTNAGVLAQDLEKTKEGKAIVKDTPDGKMVDYGKGFGLLLASMAQIHKDMKEEKNG